MKNFKFSVEVNRAGVFFFFCGARGRFGNRSSEETASFGATRQRGSHLVGRGPWVRAAAVGDGPPHHHGCLIFLSLLCHDISSLGDPGTKVRATWTRL